MMPRLPDVTAREVIRVLERLGFELDRIAGSHYVMWKAGVGTVVVPHHGSKSLPKGTLRGILKNAGVSVAQFTRTL